ncbi:uncharacterized protein LOC133906171 [Phragmites australis]|uniref:uncharacterized protein LOC133906171 n=1 Tax=Phragmites australis TaxID=29695 RepID=UPI002D78924E|nr:uncharacterized protein LOC133906171 [Phragmites australis]XP_062203962.1 uncharacterized protein LOC133906171 [Phragmites australis]
MDSDQDSDDDWVLLDSSSDDDRVLALSSGCTSPDCRSDDDEEVVADGPEGLFELEDVEEVPQTPPPPPKAISGIFYHTLTGAVSYAAFDTICCWPPKQLIPDPAFSTCSEGVTVLASTRGLVCLRGTTTGAYFIANPTTLKRTRLPRHHCDHVAHGDPAVVITFDDPYNSCADHCGHYHVVVAFPLGEGTYAYESFSSRTWQWRVAGGISAVEQVVSSSGVGALGRAFWRTTLGYFVCYDPLAATADLVPAPQEVMQWPCWELGEMEGFLCVTFMDELVNQVVVIRLHLEHRAGEISWTTLTGHFEGGCLRNRDGVMLLRSQGPAEVLMWDPTAELVVAMDLEGRTTRTIGPLSGLQYYADFIPYVSSSTGIFGDEADAECTIAADAEAY